MGTRRLRRARVKRWSSRRKSNVCDSSLAESEAEISQAGFVSGGSLLSTYDPLRQSNE